MKLFEVMKPTKGKTKPTIIDIPWDDEPTANLPAAAPQASAPTNTEEPAKPQRRNLGRTVSAAKTAEKTAGVSLDPAAAERLRGFLNTHGHENTPRPETTGTDLEPVEPADIPAVMSNALQASGVVTPEWHAVANLPGNMKRAIDTLGRQLFGQYTSTPTEEIQMIGNLGGQGPNDAREINAVASWLSNAGNLVTDGEIDFSNIMPGYKAQIRVYNAEGVQAMLVQDDYGQYIYAWPEQDSKIDSQSSQKQLANQSSPRRLTR